MELLEYLTSKFGYNEPILLEEILPNGYSKPWVNKELAKLVKSDEVIRFDKGIYYVPTSTLLGPSRLNPQKVIEKKYIGNAEERNGYYSGAYLLNQLGFSTQVPDTVEIFTNNENSKVRAVNVGTVRVLLRRARTNIDKTNVAVQSFLELMGCVSASFFDEERKKLATKYIRDYGITRDDISKYAPAFPSKAMRTLVESQVIFDVTQ